MNQEISSAAPRNLLTKALLLFALCFALIGINSAAAASSLFDTISADSSLSKFSNAVRGENINGLLSNNGPFTLFVPADSAISGDLSRQDILYHIVVGRLDAATLRNQTSVRTALGQNINISVEGNTVILNGSARVITADVEATNGVIHVISQPLNAPGFGSSPQPPAPGPQPPAPGPQPPAPTPGNPGTITTAPGNTVINVTSQVALANSNRLGINLGQHDQFGARQLFKNIVPNPGFEPGEFGMIFISYDGASANRVQADNWELRFNNDTFNIGQPAGFWNGAQFEVLSGPATGCSGSVNSFTYDGGRSTFNISGCSAVPAQGSAIAVRHTIGGYDAETHPSAKAQRGDVRPGSPGTQSLRLTPASNFSPSWREAFDSYARDLDPSAGKLLQVDGQWRFSVWAKGEQPGATLRVRFMRIGGNVFLDETIPLTQGWQQIQRTFNAEDPHIAGTPNAVFLDFFVNGTVLVDDVSMSRANYNNPTEFSDRLVNDLRELRPGVLRYWGGQLGSSLDNLLADSFARKPTAHSPRNRVAGDFPYSLHDFLQLSQMSGAEPWFVIPPTWSNGELQNLIAYLAAPAGSHPYANRRAQMGQNAPWTSVFSQIHLEYGNEIWGFADNRDPYVGGTFRGGIRAAQVADSRFEVMKRAPYFSDPKFDFIIGGQSNFTPRQQELENNSNAHETIGVAPYYPGRGWLEQWQNPVNRYNPLYAHAFEIDERGKVLDTRGVLRPTTNMAIYEINYDFIPANVPADICNDVLTSQAAAISLPLVMLAYQRDFGIRTQAAFQAVQYSTPFFRCGGTPERLFGLMRDLEGTNRKRPNWLAVELANRAIGGNMLVTNQSGPTFTQQAINGITGPTLVPFVHAFAFQQGNRVSVVLFNLDINSARNVQLNLPAGGGNATLSTLAAPFAEADNEVSQQVNIQTQNIGGIGQGYTVTLQPHSMVVLQYNR